MFYLRIDIAKNTHVASLVDERGKIIFKAHSFSNTSDGAATLLEKITPYAAVLEIGMETTGHVIDPTIVGEIGDINRFSSGAKLVAYSEIDTSVSQSGE